MKTAIDVADSFGEDVRHLHGNLFRVRRSLLRFARSGLAVKNGRLVYGNPRWYLNKDGSPEARGLESSKMQELEMSIRDSGLDNPLRLRPVGGKEPYLEVVNGERRLRCIESLCDSDDRCYDAAGGDKAPASECYEWIDCRIEDLDDREALNIALKTNETGEVIGDLASIEVVKTLRKAGYDDQDILISTGKCVSWLRETDRIVGLDEVCLGYFESDQITRKAALQLTLIEDDEERISVLMSVMDLSQRRHESKMMKLGKDLKKAEINEEIAAAATKVAMEIGDDDEASRLEETSRKASWKAAKTREDHGKAAAKGAKADARDIKKVSAEKNTRAASKPAESLGSEYLAMIELIIANEGFDSDGDSYGIDLELLTAVCCVVRSIVEGEEDIIDVLTSHCPLSMDEDAVEESEDEESVEEDFSDDEDDDDDEEAIVADSYDDEETPPELESEFRHAVVYDENEE